MKNLIKLEDIGFYTLSDKRAQNSSSTSRLYRCELILTGRCNFKCPYCRKVGGKDLDFYDAINIITEWASHKLYAIRFSGGEPFLYPKLKDLVKYAKDCRIEKIAISSNGSRKLNEYKVLIENGVNDFSISLDACCAEDGFKMSGGIKGAWDIVINNIRELSKLTYLTVGVVLTEGNINTVNDIIEFADTLGVSDIRIIPAAQDDNKLRQVKVNQRLLDKYPILRYRIGNMQNGVGVRGLTEDNYWKCPLVLDDMAVCENQHYPCIIYMREGGKPIGSMMVDSYRLPGGMKSIEVIRQERLDWYNKTITLDDPICKKNCLDVCVQFNETAGLTRHKANM